MNRKLETLSFKPHGRNQASLAFLLENKSMPWDYATLLIMLGEETLPALVRSRCDPPTVCLFNKKVYVASLST